MLGGKHHGLLSSSQHMKIEGQPSTSFAVCTSDGKFKSTMHASLFCCMSM